MIERALDMKCREERSNIWEMKYRLDLIVQIQSSSRLVLCFGACSNGNASSNGQVL